MNAFENPGEKIERGALVDFIKENGVDHEDSRRIMGEWMEQRRAEMPTTPEAKAMELALIIDQADILIETGYEGMAIECLYDALELANQEMDNETFNTLRKRLDELEV